MVQSPSWEANCFAASQEIPRISRNPKVHYRTHKRPPPISILGQPNPVHIPTSHLLEIRSNIISPSTPRSPQWSPSLRFPHQDPIHPLSSPIRATCPAYLILLDSLSSYLYMVFLNKSVTSLDSGFPDDDLYVIFPVSSTRAICPIHLIFCDGLALRRIGDAPFVINPLSAEEMMKCAHRGAASPPPSPPIFFYLLCLQSQ